MNSNYNLFNNHDDCLKLLVHSTLKYNALCGASEVSSIFFIYMIINYSRIYIYIFQPKFLTHDDFVTGVEEHGAYKGCRLIEVTPNTKNTKTKKLSLKHPTFDSNHLTHRYHKDVDDPFDFVKLFHHCNDHYLPPATYGVELGFGNRFFCQKAPNSVLNMRKKAGIMFTAGLEKNQVIGKNYFKDLM